ncbi:MAG: acyltransferase [Synergistaceae bacterium]|nr:acyltransferase [Synergistaceae bacterium]
MADHNAKVARCPLPVARCHNYALDFLKGIGCIGVVFIHIHFPGFFGRFVSRSSGFAVPLFFMISGFYAYQSDDSTIIRRLRKIFRITLFTTLIYIFYRLQHMIRHDELSGAFTAWSITRSAVRLVILSDFSFAGAGHLWFLCSLIEGYIILLAIKRFNLWKAGYIYALLAFIVSGVIFAVVPLKWHLRGNVFMSGMSWILTGHYIAENLQAVSRISRKILFASAFAGYLIGLLSLTGRMLFVSSIGFNIFPMSLFILAVREDSQAVKFPQSIVKIGAEYSLYVYLFHILVDRIYSSVLKLAGVYYNPFALWTRPLVVVVLSLTLSFVIVKVRDKISRKKSE